MHHLSICVADFQGGKQRSSRGRCRSSRRWLLLRVGVTMLPSDSDDAMLPSARPSVTATSPSGSDSVWLLSGSVARMPKGMVVTSPSSSESSVWLLSNSVVAPASSLLQLSSGTTVGVAPEPVAPEPPGTRDSDGRGRTKFGAQLDGRSAAAWLASPRTSAARVCFSSLPGFANLHVRALTPPAHTRMYCRKENITTVSKSMRRHSTTCVRLCRRTIRDMELVTL
mmetsp:Transcript_99870/g.317069  ORF Transcript_99870/g.317069 Transcript_99870/m.317069 type:complete len:225 (-) Transcript_99870:235-909(-)